MVHAQPSLRPVTRTLTYRAGIPFTFNWNAHGPNRASGGSGVACAIPLHDVLSAENATSTFFGGTTPYFWSLTHQTFTPETGSTFFKSITISAGAPPCQP